MRSIVRFRSGLDLGDEEKEEGERAARLELAWEKSANAFLGEDTMV